MRIYLKQWRYQLSEAFDQIIFDVIIYNILALLTKNFISDKIVYVLIGDIFLEADMYKRYELSEEISTEELEKKISLKLERDEKLRKKAELYQDSDRMRKNKVRKTAKTSKV